MTRREILAVVNDGYRRGSVALRSVPEGKKWVMRRFPIFGPTALAGLGRLADTTESRCVPIVLQRKPHGSAVEDFMLQLVEPDAGPLRERLEVVATPELLERLRTARPDLDELRPVRDRVREVWWPLVAIADAAGGDWPKRARQGALALHGSRAESETSDQILLLEHVRLVFEDPPVDRLSTADLLRRLVANEEGPWGGWWGVEVEREAPPRAAATELARKLRPFGVRPRVIRLADGSTPRGYLREDFVPVWATYLPDATHATDATPLASAVASVASVASTGGQRGEVRTVIAAEDGLATRVRHEVALAHGNRFLAARTLAEAGVPTPDGHAWTSDKIARLEREAVDVS